MKEFKVGMPVWFTVSLLQKNFTIVKELRICGVINNIDKSSNRFIVRFIDPRNGKDEHKAFHASELSENYE